MKNREFSSTFKKKLNKLKKKDLKLFQKIIKQFNLFKSDQSHASLRIHKLKGELKDVYSLSVAMNYRLLFIEDESYYFFDMGTHDQVYRN